MRTRDVPAGDFDYEAGGEGYRSQRRPDPRIAALIHVRLDGARTVLNVGAGAGSYEPADRHVVAVEPSRAMRAQRPPGLAPAIDATAERLPFDDDAFDAAMAIITIHQWSDTDRGLSELRRVSRGPVVILTFDAEALGRFWLAEYFPEVVAAERRRYPSIEHIAAVLGGRVEAIEVPIPHDCVDGFGDAYFGRPEAFLEPVVRRSQSAWGFVDPAVVERQVERLRHDLASGAWDARHGRLRSLPEYRGAVRLVTARPG